MINGNLKKRLRDLISISWEIFSNKVGNGLIEVNKEKSMQLQYAYILQQTLPFIIFNSSEEIKIELEKTVSQGGGYREIDIFLACKDNNTKFNVAIELKCYKTTSSSGKPRAAQNLFMEDVYFDLYLLEDYIRSGHADIGISLVMHDYPNFVNPTRKSGACWQNFDISDGYHFKSKTVPFSKCGSLTISKEYSFNWKKINSYSFVELEGN